MLKVKRRHSDSCPFRPKGGNVLNKCHCPLYATGTVKGERLRPSLNTCNLEIAWRKAREIEEELTMAKAPEPIPEPVPEKIGKTFPEAAAAFLARRKLAPSTMRKERRITDRLCAFTKASHIETIDQLQLEDLDPYKASRRLSELSWQKELQLLRTFFGFAVRRKWCSENPAKEMEMPRNPQPEREREPYTQTEIIDILAAADSFGKYPYERRRARAALLLMRFYGFRISDVATLRRDAVKGADIRVRALKNKKPLWQELYPVVREALDALPLPKGASADCPYFFWTGLGDRDGHIKRLDRTLQAVYRKSGVKNAISHRFRHTLATEILVNGGTIEDVAIILGDSPAVIRKHYAKYSSEYQHRIETLMKRVHSDAFGAELAHSSEPISNPLKGLAGQVVAEVGLEIPRRRKN